MTALTAKIANISYPVLNESFSFPDHIEQSSQCNFSIRDDSGAYSFEKGQIVTVEDTLEGRIYTGSIHTVKRSKEETTGSYVKHTIECVDLHAVLESTSSNKQYERQYMAAILLDQIKYLKYRGIITANFAMDQDATQGDFVAGTHTNTIATANVDDGCLELAPAGAAVSYTDAPAGASTTPTIKFTGTAASGFTDNHNERMIWSGSITPGDGDTWSYDIFLPDNNPKQTIGINYACADGTKASTSTDSGHDDQGLSPWPTEDLDGLATNQWYHRNFGVFGAIIGNEIIYFSVVMEGDEAGNYVAYFKNVIYHSVSDGDIEIFGNTATQIQTMGYLSNNGYRDHRVEVVNTYVDLQQAAQHSISSVNIVKSSFISWDATIPATALAPLVDTSIDSGASWQTATNNAAVANLLAGMSVAGRNIFYRISLLLGSDPEHPPQIQSIRLVVNPAYIATKSDAVTTTTDFATGTLTNAMTAGSGTPGLTLNGYSRNWNDANYQAQTFFGSGDLFVINKKFYLRCDTGFDARSRMVFAGQLQNFTAETDITIHSDSTVNSGATYRTTNENDNNNTCGYIVKVYNNQIQLGRGTNSASGSGSFTSIATATVSLAADSVHRLKLVVNGNSHQIYLDGIRYINASNSTYTAAGYIGLRLENASGASLTRAFDNFGVVSALVGTWQSSSIDISGPGVYGGSSVFWDENSIPNGTAINARTSIDGGATWQDVINGGISGLIAGQSLSGKTLKIKMTLTASTPSTLPVINGVTAWIMGQYSASGTRVSSLLLDSAGRVGSTLAAYDAIQPIGTNVVMGLSLDGISYANVVSGDPIPGITQQPDATIDSFNLITSGRYSSTARIGGTAAPWTWDTANSRLTVSGGTNALLVYGAISCKDADLIFDLDQADNCGVIWRWTDASNYYELLACDGSSNTGSTNVLKLFKVVANAKTQIGSNISVTLIRGNKYRVRVTMIGTTITVYLDGASVRSTTDSALAGPGQCGLSSVGGVGRIYNLRIQPLGDDLTGKKVYHRLTLASTVATATPQVTSATVLATNPNIGIGAIIDTADYQNTYLSDNIGDLAKRSGYFWTVLADGNLVCHKRETRPAPWVLTSNDVLVAGLEVEESGDLYRNRQKIKGAIATLSTNETQIGNNKAASWPLKYNVVSVALVTLNGQSVAFGAKGDTGKSFYYEVGSNTLAQDTSERLLQQTDVLYIEYTGQYETAVTRDNLGQFSGTVSQWDYIIRSGITIPTPVILNQASAAQTANGTSDDLDVSLIKNITVDINITAHSGTNPTAQFFIDRKGPDGIYYPIWQSVVITASSAQISTSIGPNCAYRQSLGALIQLRWIIGGTSSPSKTFSVSIIGKLDVKAAGLGVVEAIEDVSGQNMSVTDAEALADSRLQEHGVIGRILRFGTTRTGLAAGQSLNVHIPEHKIVDAETLITSVDRTQTLTVDSGQPSQFYWFKVVAVEGPALDSWSKAMNSALKGGKA